MLDWLETEERLINLNATPPPPIRKVVADGSLGCVVAVDGLDPAIYVFDGESCILFNGTNSYISCPAGPSLNLTGPLTIEAWIHPTGWGEFPNLGLARVVDKNTVSLCLIDVPSSYHHHSLLLILTHGDGTVSYTNTPENSISLNQWQHVADIYNGIECTNLMKMDFILRSSMNLRFSAGKTCENTD